MSPDRARATTLAAAWRRPGLLCDLIADLDHWPPPPRPRAPLPEFDDADSEKIAPHVLSLSNGTARDPRLDRQWAAITRKRKVLAGEALAIAEAARATASRILFLRGFAMDPYYPDGYLRQFNDLDVVAATEADGDRLLRQLHRRGYFHSRPAVAIRSPGDRRQPLWMLFSLKALHPDLPEPVFVDLVLGGPAATSVSRLPLPISLFEHPGWVAVDGGRLPVPDALHCLLVLITEMYERRQVTVRDLLDFDRVLGRIKAPEQAATEVARHRFEAQVERLAQAATQLGAPELARRLRLLAPRHSGGAPTRWFGPLLPHAMRHAWADSPSTALLRLAVATAGPLLDRVEDRVPGAALNFWRHVPPRHGYRLGLPIYLFPLLTTVEPAAPGEERFPDTYRRERFSACGRMFLARCRPVVDETELGLLEPAFDAG